MHSQQKAANSKEWISLVNAVSCVAVVLLHTNGCFWTFSKERYWITANFIEGLFYFAVPCFIMLTGATLLDFRERYSIKTYFSKRIRKTVIPYLAWSFIGILAFLLAGRIQASDITPAYLWDGIINSKIVPIYWYFTVLFGVYLTIPVLASIDARFKESMLKYACAAGFITIFLIPPLVTVFTDLTWNFGLNFQMGGYIIYACSGWLVASCEISPVMRKTIYVLALLGFMVHTVGTYILSMQAGTIIATYKGYINAPTALYSTGVIVWLKYHTDKIMDIGVIRKMVNMLSPYTMSIYLMQYYIYNAFMKVFGIAETSTFYRLVSPFVVIVVGVAIAWLLKKIPVLRNIVPG